ncbi:MAG: hypothetical protein MJZ78_07285 [Bacteroidales bacterium]|nr:hypothetical protein [Bacteroidales bacterium]
MNFHETLRPYVKPPTNYCRHELFLTPRETIVDGVISRTLDFVDVDFSKINEQFKPSDFALSNVIAVGATSQLKEMKLSSSDYDNLNTELDNLIDEYDNSLNN